MLTKEFAQVARRIYAVECDAELCKQIHKNLADANIHFQIFHIDYLLLCHYLKQDVIFFDPPWVELPYFNGMHIADLVRDLYMCKQISHTRYILFKLSNRWYQHYKNELEFRLGTLNFKTLISFNKYSILYIDFFDSKSKSKK